MGLAWLQEYEQLLGLLESRLSLEKLKLAAELEMLRIRRLRPLNGSFFTFAKRRISSRSLQGFGSGKLAFLGRSHQHDNAMGAILVRKTAHALEAVAADPGAVPNARLIEAALAPSVTAGGFW